MSKTIAVIGATGAQGTSVVHSFLKDGSWTVRGITRKPNSSNAKSLASQGVDVVTADLDDVGSLVKAFEGVQVVFGVTNFFDTFHINTPEDTQEVETKQARNLADAAAQTSTLEHYVWSTTPSSLDVSNGKHSVPHFNSKSAVDKYIKSKPALLEKTTFLVCAFYANNMQWPLLVPNKLQTAGKHVWLQPVPASTMVTTIGSIYDNLGPFVKAIVAQPKLTLPGRYVLAETETLTKGEMLKAWSEATGQETQYVEISMEDYNSLWPKWGLELGVMLKYFGDHGEDSWGAKTSIGKNELGIKDDELVSFKDALTKFDWGLA